MTEGKGENEPRERVCCLRSQEEMVFMKKGHEPGGKYGRKALCRRGQAPLAAELTGSSRDVFKHLMSPLQPRDLEEPLGNRQWSEQNGCVGGQGYPDGTLGSS